MGKELLISAANVTKKYKQVVAVNNISIDILAGEIYGVAGLNGAGKSTLLAILAGIIRPDAGTVAYRGHQAQAEQTLTSAEYTETERIEVDQAGSMQRIQFTGRSARASGLNIGYVPQDIALFQDLSVYDNMKFWALANGRGSLANNRGSLANNKGSLTNNKESHANNVGAFTNVSMAHATKKNNLPIKERIKTIASEAGLSDRLRQPVRSLSGGLKQRVNIASALVAEPDVLIMDEPTAGLDVKNRRDILNYVNALAKRRENKLAVVCTSHQSGELEMISDRLLLLDRGSSVYYGKPANIYREKYASYDNIDDIMYSLDGSV